MSGIGAGPAVLGKPDLDHSGRPVHRTRIIGAMLASGPSGQPGWKPYVWHDPDAERHAEVQATLARIRAQAARNFASETPGGAS